VFGLTYFCYGLLSLILAQAYVQMGIWGLAVFAMPVVLARQALAQGRLLEVADGQLRVQSEALRDASSRSPMRGAMSAWRLPRACTMRSFLRCSMCT